MATKSSMRFVLCVLLALAFFPPRITAQERDLRDLSLEELMSVEVTSVSKKSEQRSHSAAAISVITAEDIRRSGATTLMEALRMVPGVHVARLDANKWSITMRGTSGRFANKMLVLVDGRSIYTPLYSGVEWQAKTVPLEEVERIEVVRGPGGTLWGANAVNGVINIVTKSAKESLGGQLRLRAGTEEGGGYLHYGEELHENGAYKVYGAGTAFGEGKSPDRQEQNDSWERYILGFRTDWGEGEDSYTVQGDYYHASVSELSNKYSVTLPSSRIAETGGNYDGANVLGRWKRTLSETEELEFQVYYDYARQDYSLQEERHTIDAQFQHRFRPNDRHELNWGLEYRVINDRLRGNFYAQFPDPDRTLHLVSLFLQDDIKLNDNLRLWLGTKVEYNEFTGLEIQPSIRAAYTPDERQTLWASVSRAVRTPSLVEDAGLVTLTAFPLLHVVLQGKGSFDAEELIAYEAGYRRQLGEEFAIDAAAYLHEYKKLRTLELKFPGISLDPFPPHLDLPFQIDNNATAEAYGLEVGLEWKPLPQLRTRLAYTWSVIDADVNAATFDPITEKMRGDTPEQQVYLQAMWDISRQWELDTTLRYVDGLPAFDVDAYLTADVRLAWKPRENLELSIVGQNLLQPDHEEFQPSFIMTLPTDVERSVYGQISWKF